LAVSIAAQAIRIKIETYHNEKHSQSALSISKSEQRLGYKATQRNQRHGILIAEITHAHQQEVAHHPCSATTKTKQPPSPPAPVTPEQEQKPRWFIKPHGNAHNRQTIKSNAIAWRNAGRPFAYFGLTTPCHLLFFDLSNEYGFL
jgi:hypothetical protein